jgi:hypothetical protein
LEHLLKWTIENRENAWSLDRLAEVLRKAIADSSAFADPSEVIRDEHRRIIDCSFRDRTATFCVVGDPVKDWSRTIYIYADCNTSIFGYLFRFRSIRQCLDGFRHQATELIAQLHLRDDTTKCG